MMDNEYRIDLPEVFRNIAAAPILSIYLPLIRRSLLVDARFNELEGPMIRVMPTTGNREERFRGLQRLRPRFPQPEQITVIPWPRPVAGLERLGILDALLERFAQAGQVEAIRQTRQVYQEVLDLERQELYNALTGENYRSLWERSGQTR